MTTVLRQRPIDETGLNYDSDQDILSNTRVEDGKWRFYERDTLLAEADAPANPTREVYEQWCKAVRARTKRELTLDDEARKENARAIVDKSGDPIASADSDLADDPAPTVDVEDEPESPDAWIDEKIAKATARLEAVREREKELQEEIQALGEEAQQAAKELTKWQKLKGAMADDD